MRTKRKPRTKSKEMCYCCYSFNCDPMTDHFGSPWDKKKRFRLKNNLCVSCGKNPCECKRRKYPSNIKK